MLIIVEGADGTGKTTFVNALRRSLEDAEAGLATVEVQRKGPPRFHPVVEYEVPLWRYRPTGARHVICDRWHWGEVVYPGLLDRKTELDNASFWHIELTLRARGAVVVHKTATVETIKHRVAERGDDLVTPDVAARSRDVFWHVADASILPKRVSYEDDHVTRATRSVIEWAHRTAEECRDLSRFVTYVGPPRPRLLLLGETRGVNGAFAGPTDVGPAFVPYRTTSGHYLLGALYPQAGYPSVAVLARIGLANACDVDDPLELWKTLGRPEVVALGRAAQLACKIHEVPHRAAPHPQYVRRFHHRRRHEYAEQVLSGREVSWS